MKPKEVLNGLGYLVGADVFMNTQREDDRLINETVKAPLKNKPFLFVKSSWNLLHGSTKQVLVIPYRASGLDLASKGVRKILNRNKL